MGLIKFELLELALFVLELFAPSLSLVLYVSNSEILSCVCIVSNLLRNKFTY